MADKPVTDPSLISRLEGTDKPVSDPKVVEQLEGKPQAPTDNHPVLGPWASAAVRPIVKGVTALPAMAADALSGFKDIATGNIDTSSVKGFFFGAPGHRNPSQDIDDALDRYTMRPDTFVGKASEFVSSLLTGGMINPEGIGLRAAYGEMAGVNAAANTGRTAVVREAKQAGFKMEPEGVIGNTMASASGKAHLQRDLSRFNSERTQTLTKLALDHPTDHPLSYDALDQIRENYSRPYDVLASTGMVRADEGFMEDVSTAGAQFSKVDRAFPNEPGVATVGGPDASQIEALKGKYFQPQFTARESIDAMRQLRKDASANLRNYDPTKNALGLVQRQIADAFESRLERHAADAGMPQLVPQFRASRVRIAQSYAVQDAMNRATGEVSALDLSRLYENGAPLTGELQTIARAASAEPRAFQDAWKIGKEGQFSTIDFLVAAGAYLHNPSLGAAIIARPAMRKMLMSRMAQRMGGQSGGQALEGALPGMAAPAIHGAGFPAPPEQSEGDSVDPISPASPK